MAVSELDGPTKLKGSKKAPAPAVEPAAPAPNLSARNIEPVDMIVPLASIHPSPLNPRKRFDAAALLDLADSIAQDGLLEPIVVRPIDGSGVTGLNYHIVAGERRWRACQKAGLTEIPVRILDGLTDEAALRLAIVENVQRENLDPIEEAAGYAQLAKLGMRQSEIAAQVKKSQPAVANRLGLLDLPEDVQDRIRQGELTAAHGVAIRSLRDIPGISSKLAELAIAQKWTAHQTEDATRELRKISQWPEMVEACLDPSVKALQKQLGKDLWIPGDLSKQVETVLTWSAHLEERLKKIDELKQQGKMVLDKKPHWEDKSFVELHNYGEGLSHTQLGLTCEAYWVETEGQPWVYRYCTDPHALRSAMAKDRKGKPISETELKIQEETRLKLARIAARDAVIRNWADRFQYPTADDLVMFARRRMDHLVKYEDAPLLHAANWMGVRGKSKSEKIAAVKERIVLGETRELLRVWMLAEFSAIVNGLEPIPDWMQPWLAAQGYVDPAASPVPETAPATVPIATEVQPPKEPCCGRPAVYRMQFVDKEGQTTSNSSVCDDELHMMALDPHQVAQLVIPDADDVCEAPA